MTPKSFLHLGTLAGRTAFALAALLAPACTQSPTRPSRVALDDYARTFAPTETRTLANAVEVTAPRIEPGDGDELRLAGADGTREVRVRMLAPKDWDGVERLSARADPDAEPPLSDQTLEQALAEGLVAHHAELRANRATLTLRLHDVALPGSDRRAEWVDVTLDFVRLTAATLAAVRTAGPGNGAASVQRLSGD